MSSNIGRFHCLYSNFVYQIVCNRATLHISMKLLAVSSWRLLYWSSTLDCWWLAGSDSLMPIFVTNRNFFVNLVSAVTVVFAVYVIQGEGMFNCCKFIGEVYAIQIVIWSSQLQQTYIQTLIRITNLFQNCLNIFLLLWERMLQLLATVDFKFTNPLSWGHQLAMLSVWNKVSG